MFLKEWLNDVYIRTKLEDGSWGNVSLMEATDKQFDMWAKGRVEIQDPRGEGMAWPTSERRDFCEWVEEHHGPLARIIR